MLRNMKRRRPKLSAGITSEKITDITCTTARVAGESLLVDLVPAAARGHGRVCGKNAKPQRPITATKHSSKQHRKGNHSALMAPWS